MSSEPKSFRVASGKVISAKMDKTIVVLVEWKAKHPKYGKFVTRKTKLYAHDEHNKCNIGDEVKIRETRPYSKTKTWLLLEVETK